MMKGFLLAAIVASTGCVSELSTDQQAVPQQSNPAPARPLYATPRRTPSSSASTAVADERTRAGAILDRVAAIKAATDEALALDGTEAAIQVRRQMYSCQGDKIACARQLESHSKTGALIGLADAVLHPVPTYLPSWKRAAFLPRDLRPILGIENDLPVAEDLVKKAGQEAQRVADARAEQQKKLDAEAPAISDAAEACAKNESACKAKCDTGKDGYSCLAWAAKLRNARPPKLADAKSYIQKSCNAGVQHGCTAIPIVDKQIQDASAEVESLWSYVRSAGDDLTLKRHQTGIVATMANRPHLKVQVQQMRAINDAIFKERYCPAKKDFLASASSGEFQHRAAAHCKDDPPTGTGLSGTEVTLTSECQAVYASPCP